MPENSSPQHHVWNVQTPWQSKLIRLSQAFIFVSKTATSPEQAQDQRLRSFIVSIAIAFWVYQPLSVLSKQKRPRRQDRSGEIHKHRRRYPSSRTI